MQLDIEAVAEEVITSLSNHSQISTGTLTLAMPIKPGERWTARAAGIPLEPITIEFGRLRAATDPRLGSDAAKFAVIDQAHLDR